MKRRQMFGWIVFIATIVIALAPLAGGEAEIPIWQHHLFHAVIIFGAVVAGIALFTPAHREPRPSPAWLVAAMIAPGLAMVMMWPSEYGFFETHAFGHALEHLGIAFFALASAVAGQRFAAGVGWATGASALGMALLCAPGFGVSPPPARIALAATAESSSEAPAKSGAAIFAQNCAVCHGSAGGGASGPPLKDERARKNLEQTVEWIEHPLPPMPTLYPMPLSEGDVKAVAAYVQSL